MPTEDKSTLSSLSPQDQRGTDRLQNNQMEDTIKHLRDRGYKVTEEYSNTGQLSKVSGEHPQRKTGWDWLQLLIIPLLISFLGIGFTWVQNQTSLQIAQDNRQKDIRLANDQQQEATLKAYLDDMTTLLLDKKLGSQAAADKDASAEAAIIARVKTLTTLRRLKADRNRIVLQFLQDAHLIGARENPVIDLSYADLRNDDLGLVNLFEADLRDADLSGADLNGADLNGANLYQVVLYQADLHDARLSYANLRDANLRDANLRGAYLAHVDLSLADLSGANLSGAYLRGAILASTTVTNEQLAQAKSLAGASMPDGSIHP